MNFPTWQSLITELVPREELAAATRLDMVSVNVSRAAGPAIAGFVIAVWGVPPVFALNAAAAAVLTDRLAGLAATRGTRPKRPGAVPARAAAGGRYVRHEPVIRTILLRFATVMFPAGAVWALLPLIASRQLAAGRWRLRAAVLRARCRRRGRPPLGSVAVKQHLSSNQVLAVAAALFAARTAGLAVTSRSGSRSRCWWCAGSAGPPPSRPSSPSCSCSCPVGSGPAAIAIYLMVFLGTQAVAAPIWGLAVTQYGSSRLPCSRPPRWSASARPWSASCGCRTAMAWTGRRWRTGIPRGCTSHPATSHGPVMVSIQYEVPTRTPIRLPGRHAVACADPGSAPAPPAGRPVPGR